MLDFWDIALILAKFSLYLGLLASIGIALVRLIFPQETRGMHDAIARQATAFAGLGLSALVIEFALKSATLTGEASSMLDTDMLGMLWQTPVGTAFAYRFSGLAMILIGMRISRFGLPIAAAGCLVALWSFTATGHVADEQPYWLTGILILHLACAAFWIGILSPLRAISEQRESLREAASLGFRFGKVASFAVPGLIAAGIVMAWLLVGELALLTTTAYGLALVMKVAAVGVLLSAAAVNKLRFIPAMRLGDRNAALRLRRSIAVEWVAFCFIIMATAVLTSLPTPMPQGVS